MLVALAVLVVPRVLNDALARVDKGCTPEGSIVPGSRKGGIDPSVHKGHE